MQPATSRIELVSPCPFSTTITITLRHSSHHINLNMDLFSEMIVGLIYIHIYGYMCFNQRGDISTLNDSSLKLVDNFTYLGSSVLSTCL